MKKIVVRIVIVVAILAVLGGVCAFFCLNGIVKKGVDTVGPELTKAPIRLQAVNISPFSGSGQLQGLFVGNPEGFKTPAAFELGSVKVAVKVSSLLSDSIVVEEVHVQAPEITLEGSLKGSNLGKILENVEATLGGASETKDSKDKPAEPASKGGKKIQIKDFVIKDGKVNLSVTALGGKAMTVPLPDIHLQNIGVSEGGVPPAEAIKEVLKAVIANVTKAAGSAATSVGEGAKELGKDGAQAVDKAAKGIKGLFKK